MRGGSNLWKGIKTALKLKKRVTPNPSGVKPYELARPNLNNYTITNIGFAFPHKIKNPKVKKHHLYHLRDTIWVSRCV